MVTHTPEFDPVPVMNTEEPLTPFNVHESSERSGLFKLVVTGAILLAIALIVLKLYQPGTRARTDPPLITADAAPFKVVPEEVGGAQTPDQDKEVFEVMGGSVPSTTVVTRPAPEAPVALPAPKPVPTPAPEPVQRPVVEAPTPRPTPAPAPVVQAPVQRPAPSVPASSGGSNWVVQVASLRSQAEADATASKILLANRGVLGSFGTDIRRVDLAEKGIYYRARFDGFADKAEADATCARLKSAGQACFVTKR